MPALIPELIALASDPTVKTTDLLRKALVAARLLKQHEWAAWINNELQGYPDDSDLPLYRVIRCELKARNPFHGLIPIIIDDLEYAKAITTCRIGQSISGLEELAIPGKNLSVHLPPEMMAMLMQDLNIPMEPKRVVGGNQIRALIDAVRDKLLTWALDLAEAGIQGEGMSFTPQEQQEAQQLAPVNIHIGGNATGFQFMQNSHGGQQQQTVTSEQKQAALAALLPWLAQVIAQGKLQREVCAELQAELDTLKAQAASPNPKWPVIGAVAGSVRTILEGAGGGVVAELALGWLATLAGN
ncbi:MULTISPECIES: AbiTii domain-containing protein [Aeromonas]|uniref:AbiTii domain-containing protein n=1 Tax=Aeromonas TaxID=642 RepID=UPI003F328CA6